MPSTLLSILIYLAEWFRRSGGKYFEYVHNCQLKTQILGYLLTLQILSLLHVLNKYSLNYFYCVNKTHEIVLKFWINMTVRLNYWKLRYLFLTRYFTAYLMLQKYIVTTLLQLLCSTWPSKCLRHSKCFSKAKHDAQSSGHFELLFRPMLL